MNNEIFFICIRWDIQNYKVSLGNKAEGEGWGDFPPVQIILYLCSVYYFGGEAVGTGQCQRQNKSR